MVLIYRNQPAIEMWLLEMFYLVILQVLVMIWERPALLQTIAGSTPLLYRI